MEGWCEACLCLQSQDGMVANGCQVNKPEHIYQEAGRSNEKCQAESFHGQRLAQTAASLYLVGELTGLDRHGVRTPGFLL